MSSTDTLENIPQSEPTETTHDHVHEDHDHDHAHEHGPVFNPDCTREVVIDIPAEDISKTWDGVVREYRKHARIPGFRPGKTPEAVVKRRFASEIRKDVIDRVLPSRFNKAVTELGVSIVGQPQVTELTMEEGQPLHVKASFEYVPEFSISGYESVKVEKPTVELTDEEFNLEMKELQESRATIEPVEKKRKIADGDLAQISYSGKIEGEDAPLASEDTLVEIGGKNTLEAFNNALRGTEVGQSLKIEVIYPEDYAEASLKGKTATYDVEVKGIKTRILPELNDDFAKEMGNYDNLDALKTAVREHMANRKRRSVEGETKDRLMAALGEKFTFPVPESLVQSQIDTRLERGLRALAAQGMGAEQMRQLDFQRLRAAQRDGALSEIKSYLILDKIAKAEKIEINEEEMERELHMASLQSREPLETLRNRLAQDGSLHRIREQLLREKTATALYERL